MATEKPTGGSSSDNAASGRRMGNNGDEDVICAGDTSEEEFGRDEDPETSRIHYTIVSHTPGSTKFRIIPTAKLKEKVQKLEEKLAASENALEQAGRRLQLSRASTKHFRDLTRTLESGRNFFTTINNSLHRENNDLWAHNDALARDLAMFLNQRNIVATAIAALHNINAIDPTTGRLRTMQDILIENDNLNMQLEIEHDDNAALEARIETLRDELNELQGGD